MELKQNRFKRDLGKRQQIGLFSTLASPILVELFGGCGFDWILIDTEHSPSELPGVITQLQALDALGANAIVRPAWSDMVLVKRFLDAGAQTILLPYIQNADEAAKAVSYTRYPPHGVRGVSGASRAASYGLVKDYVKKAAAELCVLVQIETAEALDDLENIAAVDGVDGVFIGPSDLAASLGHLGNAQHPEVQKVIDEAFRRVRKAGKPTGYLTTNEEEAARRVKEGVDFVGVGTDTSIITRATTSYLQRLRGG